MNAARQTLLGLTLCMLQLPTALTASTANTIPQHSSVGMGTLLMGGALTATLSATCIQFCWNRTCRAKSLDELNQKYKPTIEDISHKIENFIYQSDLQDFTRKTCEQAKRGEYEEYSHEVIKSMFEDQHPSVYFAYADIHRAVKRSDLNIFMQRFIQGDEAGTSSLINPSNQHEEPNHLLVHYLNSFALREKNPILKNPQYRDLQRYYQGANRLRDTQGKTFINDPVGTIKRFFSRY